jgi:hypothetical protein
MKKGIVKTVVTRLVMTAILVSSAQKYPHPAMIAIEQPSQQQVMAMDAYGQQIEPICNYRTSR